MKNVRNCKAITVRKCARANREAWERVLMRVFSKIILCAGLFAVTGLFAADKDNSEIPKTSRNGTSAGDLEKQMGKSPDKSQEQRSIGAQAGHYFLSRFYDLIDCVDFSVGAGPGFLINARITKLAQAIGGYSDAYR